jgi:DNA-binding NtrC family response regulator
MSNATRRKRKLLFVDDDQRLLEDAMAVLGRIFECVGESDPDRVLQACSEHEPDVVLLDVMFGDKPVGFDLLTRIRAEHPFLPVIMWTDDKGVEVGLRAQELGAFHTVRKTPSRGEIVPAVEACLRRRSTDIYVSALEHELGREWGSFVHASESMKELLDLAASAAQTELAVLITGERGVGKGVLAHEIHKRSGRAGRQFITVDCSGIAADIAERELFGHAAQAFSGAVSDRPGLCDAADGGTLFLDEIGDTSPGVQSNLRRLSQEKLYRPVGSTKDREADVRIIAATNRDLGRDIEEGTFRADLYDRLAGFRLHIPPLRERRDDILALADSFLAARCADTGCAFSFSPDARLYLESQDWPGNVRALELAVARACAIAQDDVITATHLAHRSDAGPTAAGLDLSAALKCCEREQVTKALRAAGGDKTEAARLLGVSRMKVYRAIKDHGITDDDF